MIVEIILNGLICNSPVFESFKEYVTVESLDGDNKYDAGEYGLQVSYFCKFLSTFSIF